MLAFGGLQRGKRLHEPLLGFVTELARRARPLSHKTDTVRSIELSALGDLDKRGGRDIAQKGKRNIVSPDFPFGRVILRSAGIV